MTLHRLTFWCAVLILVIGCERRAEVANPKHFRDDGISFDYPGNWKVTKNATFLPGRVIVLEEPGSAIVVLRVYPAGSDVSLEQFAGEVWKNALSGIARDFSTAGQADAIDYSIHSSGLASRFRIQ